MRNQSEDEMSLTFHDQPEGEAESPVEHLLKRHTSSGTEYELLARRFAPWPPEVPSVAARNARAANFHLRSVPAAA